MYKSAFICVNKYFNSKKQKNDDKYVNNFTFAKRAFALKPWI